MIPGERANEPTSQHPPGDYCPTCGRKYIETKKKYMGMSGDKIFVIVLVIVIIIVGLVGVTSMYIETHRMINRSNHVDVKIANGGYYSEPLDSYATHTMYAFSISAANGSRIDAYIMTGDQYYQAYQVNNTTQSFAALESHENINQVQFTYVLDQSITSQMMIWGNVMLVLDNRDLSLTPNDAVPQGDVSVSLDIVTSYSAFTGD